MRICRLWDLLTTICMVAILDKAAIVIYIMTSFSKKLSFTAILFVAVIAIAVTVFIFRPRSPAPAQPQSDYKVEVVTDGLVHPWGMAFLPDNAILVTERPGRLKLYKDGNLTSISGTPEIFAEGQGGLLDVVLDPDFENNRIIYLSYSAEENGRKGTEIYKAQLASDKLVGGRAIFKVDPKVPEGANHFGSRLVFDAQGYLYATIGDRFNYMEEAQNPENHLGSVVRLNTDGTVPEDSAYPNGVFAYGTRNAQGIILHPETGDIWIHEHGPRGGDEINILKKGANYGWPKVTFGIDYDFTTISDKEHAPGVTDPIHQWTPSIAPSGMIFYTGEAFPQWQGDLFIGTLAAQHLRRVDMNGEQVAGEYELLEDKGLRIRDVEQDSEGYIYVLTDERDGQILRLVPID